MNVASGSYEYEGFLGSKLNNLRSFELQSKISHSYKKKMFYMLKLMAIMCFTEPQFDNLTQPSFAELGLARSQLV